MGNRISTVMEPVIMTATFLEEKVIQNLASSQELDVSELLRLVKMDGLEYNSVYTLNFEHESLISIDEMWKFKNLTKLELPNNYLDKIEGVDCLVNLQILDLSFNFIKCICNLENLINLICLNLTSNEIVLLENMDMLKKLETFLIRKNKIKAFDNIYYLKQFNNLTSLGIDKNPFMKEKDASLHIIAILPQLKYLDFNVISTEQKKMALVEFPHENNFIEVNVKGKFQCYSSHSDKEAYVEGLANGQGFQSFFLCDRNYRLLHSFPLAAEISQYHNFKATEIFDKWHEVGHNYYQLIQNEKVQFLPMISKAKELSLEVSQKEEEKFIDFKENIPKRLCLIYQQAISDNEKDKKVADLKETCEFYLQKSFRNFMNSAYLCVDIISNLCKIYEREILALNAKYVQDIEKFITDLIQIKKIFSERLQDFYLSIPSTGFDLPDEFTTEERTTNIDSAFIQIVKKKELIEMSIELSVRITSTMLKERKNNLKSSLHNDLMETIAQVSGEAFNVQSELTRNAIVFCNKQKYFIDKLFSRSSIFKHYLGY